MDHHKTENTLGISWHDTAWVPHLNQGNILDYFSEKSNPFYDRTCNNEAIKMQRLNPDQMLNMTGLEYTLLHAQEPILYIIRKQHRHSPTQVTPLANYYIIAGTVYQGPDLCTVVNSRLLNTLHNLQSAFDEALTYARFHPTRGYSWEFKEKEEKEPAAKEKKAKKKEEASSKFQRQRVDLLLGELAKKHPPLFTPPPLPPTQTTQAEEKPPAAATATAAAAAAAAATTVTAATTTAATTASSSATAAPISATTTTTAANTTTTPSTNPATTATTNGSMKPPPEKKQKLR